MNFKFYLFSIVVFVGIFSCTRRVYHDAEIDEKTKEHKTVAILPFDIEVTGRLPKGWDEAKKEEVLEQESEVFQYALMTEILNTSGRRRGKFTVGFQSVEKTRAILSRNGINHQVLKEKDPQELAQMLGVEAVFKVKMHKKRYLSNLESVAINQGTRVLSQVTKLPSLNVWPMQKTSDIRLVGSLVDAKTGNVLYNFSDACATDWTRQPNQVVAHISKWIGRKFPYRAK